MLLAHLASSSSHLPRAFSEWGEMSNSLDALYRLICVLCLSLCLFFFSEHYANAGCTAMCVRKMFCWYATELSSIWTALSIDAHTHTYTGAVCVRVCDTEQRIPFSIYSQFASVNLTFHETETFCLFFSKMDEEVHDLFFGGLNVLFETVLLLEQSHLLVDGIVICTESLSNSVSLPLLF